MKINLYSIVMAKRPIESLSKQHYRNFIIALKLADLKKLVDEKTDFYLAQEKQLISQYASKDDKGEPKIESNGQILFDTIENAQEYLKEIGELKSIKVDIGKRITIHIPEDLREDQNTLTPDEIVQLGNMINFIADDAPTEAEDAVTEATHSS